MDKNVGRQSGKFDQWLLDALLASPTKGIVGRGQFRVLSALRQVRLRISDPLVRFRLYQMQLLLPLSHELPFYKRALPEYALNLGRVVATVQQKYPNLTMIDVGANVGDSVAIVRAKANVPILCVEGEEHFFRLLAANTSCLDDIELEQAFLGAAGDQVIAVHSEQGTARISLGAAANGINTRTVEETIFRHPRFAKSKLIKLDAEGFDCRIICNELEFLTISRPVLFFEYHPPLCALVGYDPSIVFGELARAGYAVLVVYKNVGHYLRTIDLKDGLALRELHEQISGKEGFCDMAAFHEEDTDIAQALVHEELNLTTQVEQPGATEPRMAARIV